MRRLAPVVLLAALAAAPLARAQEAPPAAAGVADSLRAPARKIEGKDVPESYRGVMIGDAGGITPLMLFGLTSGSEGADNDNGVMRLLGVTLVDPDEFAELLEGRRPRIRGYSLDLAATIRSSQTRTTTEGSNRVPMPTFAETWIEAGKITQWSPRPEVSRATILAAIKVPAAENGGGEAVAPEQRAEGLRRTKRVATAFMIYLADYDDRLPKADSTAKASDAVKPYMKDVSDWKSANPNGGRILYNTALSGVNTGNLQEPNHIPLLWDENAWPDGGRIVAFADGSARYLRADEWKETWSEEASRRKESATKRPPAPDKNVEAPIPARAVTKPVTSPAKRAPSKKPGG